MSTVTVACRIPNGIRIGDIVIHGPKAHTQYLENIPPTPTVGGFVLNSGIDQVVWDRWFQANQNSDMVRNGMIYADVNENTVRQKALGIITSGSPGPVPDAMAMIRQNAGVPRR